MRKIFNLLSAFFIIVLLASCGDTNKKSITFGEESIVNTYYDYEMYEGEVVLMPFNLNYGIKDYEIRYADFKMHDIKGDNIELLSFDLVYQNYKLYLKTTCNKDLGLSNVYINEIILTANEDYFVIPIEIHIRKNNDYNPFEPNYDSKYISVLGYNEYYEALDNQLFTYVSFDKKSFGDSSISYENYTILDVSLKIDPTIGINQHKRIYTSKNSSVFLSDDKTKISYSNFESIALNNNDIRFATVQLDLSPCSSSYQFIGCMLKIKIEINGNPYLITKQVLFGFSYSQTDNNLVYSKNGEIIK